MLDKFKIQRDKYNNMYKKRTALIDFIFCDYYSGKLHYACFKKIFNAFGESYIYCNEGYQLLELIFRYKNNTTNNDHKLLLIFTRTNFKIKYDGQMILSAEYFDFIKEHETLIQTFENIYEKISYFLLCAMAISLKDELFFQTIKQFKEIINSLKNRAMTKDKIQAIMDYAEPYYPYVGYFEPQNTLFRIRECKIEEFTRPIHGLNRVCYNTINKTNPTGRFNYENEMVLYATYGNEVACFFETMPKEEYVLTSFNLKNRVLIADLTRIYDFNFSDDKVSLDNIFLNILKRKEIKEIIQSNVSSTHEITNLIKDYIIGKYPDIKGFLYNSIYDFTSYNLALLYNPSMENNIIFNDVSWKKGMISQDFLATKTYAKFNKETNFWVKVSEDSTIHTSTSYFLSQKTIIDIFKDIEQIF